MSRSHLERGGCLALAGMLTIGCDAAAERPGDASLRHDGATEAATDARVDGDAKVCNALDLDGVEKAGIGGYGGRVPYGTGGTIVDGTYVLIAGDVSNTGELYVEQRRKLVVSAGRMEMIVQWGDSITTSVRTFTTSGSAITFTDVCPTPAPSVTYDYTSEIGDTGRRRLILDEPFGSNPAWVTAYVYERR